MGDFPASHVRTWRGQHEATHLGESLPAAQLKHLLSTVAAVGGVGAVGTHGTFMDFGHMEEVKQSPCFFLNQQLLEQNIIQILVHSSKFLSERGSRTAL